MDIFHIIIFCIIATFLAITLKKTQEEFAIALTIVVGIIVFFVIFDKIAYIVDKINEISNRVQFSNSYVRILIKMTGVALLSDYTANICKDSGQTSIAAKIEFAGKILILFLSIPLIISLLDIILKLFRQ